MRNAALLVGLLAVPARADLAGVMRHEDLTLANGLRVLLLPDHRAPMVTVVTWYRVGSADEVKGKTGFAHLFEHLMFEGSPHARKGLIDELFEEVGGWTNAATSHDETVYTDFGGAPILERALWLEADRIAGLPAAIDQAKLDNQRDVVLNERRETHENRPYGMAEVYVGEHLWPEGHPYHAPIIGYTVDLAAARLDDVRAFFAAHYTPRNAVMVIAGDFDPAAARTLAEKYLGGIPAGAAPARGEPAAPAPIEREIVVKETDAVQAPRVYLVWRGPRAFSADEATLDLTAAILAGGKSSRLYQRLVVEMRLAQDVYAGAEGRPLGGEIEIVATAKPGVDPAKLTAAIDVELAALAAEPPDAAELERARNSREARELASLQALDHRAEKLAEYTALTGDPDYLPKDLARYHAVTVTDVQRAVGRWLQPAHRLNLTIQPEGKHAR